MTGLLEYIENMHIVDYVCPFSKNVQETIDGSLLMGIDFDTISEVLNVNSSDVRVYVHNTFSKKYPRVYNDIWVWRDYMSILVKEKSKTR